ncbi:MAG: Trigger factor [Parcubacteria group bacterium GW2011_GWA2_42_14]|nr:MAG: Trigger factor [Parcubacteria group bacterium GW2011_GWA2_42_14]
MKYVACLVLPMNYQTKTLPRSQIEILVNVPRDELKPFLEKAAILLTQEKPLEGFRPGRAPLEIVKQRFGEYAIYERAAKLYIEKNYPKIFDETLHKNSETVQDTLEPIGQPEITITKLAPGSELEFKIILSLLPSIALPDYKKIASSVSQEKKTPEVSEKEVEDTLNFIRESRASLITVSRPAQFGDAVEIDFETFDGITKLNGFESKSHPLVLGEKKTIPGLEEKLIGMVAGEIKEFSVKLPDNFHDKALTQGPAGQVSRLAGKNITFKTKMNLVQERKLPELTDEFAKGLGKFSGVENLRISISEGIMLEKERKEKERLRIKIADEIATKTTAEITEILINSELEKMVSELKNGVKRMGLKFDEYLSNLKKSAGDLKLDWVKDAERRVKIALVLRKIAKEEKIEPTEEEVQNEINRFISYSGMPEKETKKIDKKQIFEYAYGIARNEKVFQFLEKTNFV